MSWRHGRDKAVYGPDRLHQQETKEIRDYWQNDRKTKRQIFWIIVYFAVPVVQPLEQRPVTEVFIEKRPGDNDDDFDDHDDDDDDNDDDDDDKADDDDDNDDGNVHADLDDDK